MGQVNRAETERSKGRSRTLAGSAWRVRRRRLREARTALAMRARSSVREALAPVAESRQAVREWVEPRRAWVRPLAWLVAIGVAATIPQLRVWFMLPDWAQRATSGSALSRVALFMLFALGLNVVVGFAGLLDLGYVAFWAIGSYTGAILSGAASYTMAQRAGTVTFEDKPEWAAWMWLILLLVLAVAVIGGIVIGSPTLRLRGDYLAIVTLGLGEIIRITANNLDNVTVGPRGISSIPHPEISVGPVDLKWGTLVDIKYYYLFLFFVILWIIAIRFLDHSRIGRAWVAIREDEVAAAAMGVPVFRMKLAAFAIGACTAGVGGVIYAQQVNFINPPTFNIFQSILILVMVTVGGMGSIPGALVGATLVVLIPEIFRGLEDYRFLVFGLVLILMMAFRPQGIIPSKRRMRELRGGVQHEEQLFEVAHAGGKGS
jgi:branched-chain amino acid transport system permease protein